MEDIEIKKIDIADVKVIDNTRIRLGEQELGQLMQDIKQRGLLQPIGVNKQNDEYILLFGHRRLEAHRKLGYKKIEAKIWHGQLTWQDIVFINIAENENRENVSPIQTARQIKRLHDSGYSLSEIAVRMSVPESRVKTLIRYNEKIPKKFKKDVAFLGMGVKKKGRLGVSVVDRIVQQRISKQQTDSLFFEAKKEGYSAKQIDMLGQLLRQGMTVKQAKQSLEEYVIIQPVFAVKKTEFAKLKAKYGGITKVLIAFISGEEKPQPKLLGKLGKK